MVGSARTGKAALAVPRMPVFIAAGRREHWLNIDPRALHEWAMALLAIVLGLSSTLQAERPGLPGLPVRADVQDCLISRDRLDDDCVYVGRGACR